MKAWIEARPSLSWSGMGLAIVVDTGKESTFGESQQPRGEGLRGDGRPSTP